MEKTSRKLGAHFSIAGGLHNALLAAKTHRCQCVQLFVANQRQWKRPPLTDAQIEEFSDTRRSMSLSPVVAHSTYLINLAASDPEIREKSILTLAGEYERCTRLGIEYLVLHPGSHMGQGEAEGMQKIAGGLNEVLSRHAESRAKILLETTAGQGSALGRTFEQLAHIIERVEAGHRLGVCLDTCHVFAAGYDIRTEAAYERTVQEFDSAIGLARLAVIHVNDSKTDFGSRVDRHQHIGKGFLGRQAFRMLLQDERLAHLPFILETPKGTSPGGRDLDTLNLAALRRLSRR